MTPPPDRLGPLFWAAVAAWALGQIAVALWIWENF